MRIRRVFILSHLLNMALILSALASSAFCQESTSPSAPIQTLPAIRMEGSAAETLTYDPVVPATSGKFEKISPSGSVVREFSEELPVPVSDYGYPGQLSQIRGLGRTVEDTNVEALGVPLNLPQGGGFDFSTFPQFFWSSYEFRLGPNGAEFDLRASTGTIALEPWTASALKTSDSAQTTHSRFTALGGRFIGQSSAAVHSGDVALMAGGTIGSAHGPTGSLSLRLPSIGKFEWRAHLLATSLNAATPGPVTFFSPTARSTSARVIPIIEGGTELADGSRIKSSVFFDRNWISTSDTGTGNFSATRTDQYGIENAAVIDFMTFGANAKQVSLTGMSYVAPAESDLNFRAGPTFHWGSFTLDGYVSGDYVNGTGWKPAATAGLRDDLFDTWGVYTRESISWRYPTLIDRYYSYPGISLANPGLQPEQVMTAILGTDIHAENIRASLEGVGQFRNHAQLYVSDPVTLVGQVQNAGHADELSLIQTTEWNAYPELDFYQSFRFSGSKVSSFNQSIPYDPFFTYVAEARPHSRGDSPVWKGALGFRGVTSSPASFSPTPPPSNSPGYGLVHVDLRYRVAGSSRDQELDLEGRIENLLNRHSEPMLGYPLPGRLFALGVTGAF